MGIKKLTYRDIPASLRAKAAGEAQRRLQTVLADPVASAQQRDDARRQQGVLRQWVAGTLPVEGPASVSDAPSEPKAEPATSSPAAHEVTLDESLGVRDD